MGKKTGRGEKEKWNSSGFNMYKYLLDDFLLDYVSLLVYLVIYLCLAIKPYNLRTSRGSKGGEDQRRKK